MDAFKMLSNTSIGITMSWRCKLWVIINIGRMPYDLLACTVRVHLSLAINASSLQLALLHAEVHPAATQASLLPDAEARFLPPPDVVTQVWEHPPTCRDLTFLFMYVSFVQSRSCSRMPFMHTFDQRIHNIIVSGILFWVSLGQPTCRASSVKPGSCKDTSTGMRADAMTRLLTRLERSDRMIATMLLFGLVGRSPLFGDG